MNYRIVMDSSSNIRTMENVAFTAVPLKIITEQREFADDNTLELDRMLDYLETYKGRSGTSCPSVGDWLDAFGDADWIFALAITSSLSGSYNALVQAKAVYEQTHPERRVCALDTLSTGPEMVLIAMKIWELLRRGERFDRVETETRAYMNRTRLIFCLESMNNRPGMAVSLRWWQNWQGYWASAWWARPAARGRCSLCIRAGESPKPWG